MIKKLILLVVVLAVLVIGALVFAVMRIDSIARRGVEVAGTRATGVATTLDNITISLFGGSVNLKGLELANPSGYDSEYFMNLGKGDAAVSLGTLMEDKVVVPKVHLDGIEVNLEKKGGKANYEVILENMKQEEKSAPPPDQAPGKKFVIEELLITNVKVHAAMLPLGGSLSKVEVEIPEIRLQNVGSDSDNGVLLQEVSSTVIKAVMMAIAKKGAGILPDSIIGGLEGGLAGLEDLSATGMQVAGQAVETAGAVVKEITKVGEGVVKGAEEATKGVGKALEDVGGIFKKKSK